MFNFFVNLFLSFCDGSWSTKTNSQILSSAKTTLDSLPLWNMFNNSVNVSSSVNLNGLNDIIGIVLASISCVFLYMLVVKAIKSLCNVFVGWFR